MTRKSDPFRGKATVPLPPAPKLAHTKEPRFNFALDATNYRRLQRAKGNRDYIPGRRIA